MKWCAFDVETTGRESAFRSMAVYSDRCQVATDDPETALELLRAHAREGYTFVAHNAEFDVVNGLWRLNQDVTLHYYGATFTTAYWFWDRRRASCQVWDSLNLAAGISLKDLGDAMGCPKYPTPQRLKGIDPDRYTWFCERHDVGECIDCYNLRDAEIVWRFVAELDRFMSGYGLQVRRTLAANAVQLWLYFDPDRQQTIRSDAITRLAAAAYHGARCEPFVYGFVPNVHTYDKRNHYPAVMLSSPMPDCRYLIHAKGWPRHLNLDQVEGVVEAEVYQPPTRFPVLPMVHQERIYYPVGVVRGTWTIAELRAALTRGAELRNVTQMAWSTRFVYPFTGMMGALLVLEAELRAEADPRRPMFKALMNAIPGRLGMVTGGQRRIYRRRMPGLKPQDLKGAELQYAAGTAYLVKQHDVPRPPTTSNILWAASINAYGRLSLLSLLEAAGDTAVYCDTDSVFTTSMMTGLSDQHGGLRDTGTYASGLFLSPKQYRLEPYEGDPIHKAKGVPREVVQAYFERGAVTYDSNVGVIRALGLDLEPGTWVEVRRERSLTPARRQLLDPAALVDSQASSDTVAVVFGPDGPEAEERGEVTPQQGEVAGGLGPPT